MEALKYKQMLKDNYDFNLWMDEFKVGSRYHQPLPKQDRNHFDIHVFSGNMAKHDTFYVKIVRIVKSIL